MASDICPPAGAALAPTAWSASVAALLAWQGFHVLICALGAATLLARSRTGLLQRGARSTLDNTALLWHYANVQGLVAIGLVRGLPQLL